MKASVGGYPSALFLTNDEIASFSISDVSLSKEKISLKKCNKDPIITILIFLDSVPL